MGGPTWEAKIFKSDLTMLTGCGTTQTHALLVGVLKRHNCCCHSGTKLCPTLCDPTDCSMPGHPVHYQLPEFTQTRPLSQWCHPTNSSSVVPPSSRLQSFPASGSFPMSQFFTSGGQSIGVSALASVLPMNTQDWSHLRWTGWISLQSKGLSRVFSNTTVQKYKFFGVDYMPWSSFLNVEF